MSNVKSIRFPIVQADLVHIIDSSHSRTMTTWLDKKPGLVKGATIILKDRHKVEWIVKELYPTGHDSSEFDWHRKWDNNI